MTVVPDDGDLRTDRARERAQSSSARHHILHRERNRDAPTDHADDDA